MARTFIVERPAGGTSVTMVVSVAALVVTANFFGHFFALGCTENLEAGTSRAEVCDSIGELWTATWWLAVIWPAVLFAASQLVPPLRRHPIVMAAAAALLMIAFWTPLLLVVSHNLVF